MCKDGIKYDTGKPRLYEMIEDFKEPLVEVTKVWTFGADKYGKHNWAYVDNAIDRYSNALLRHLLKGDSKDKESQLLHASHVAWNALARLHFIIKSGKTVDVGFWDKNGVYKEDFQEVDLEKERVNNATKNSD